jgi:ABC-type transport system involved in multi-copper enzyme maturation permease subunit
MSSKAFTESGSGRSNSPWTPTSETAPSVVVGDDPTLLRTVGVLSALLVSFGGAVILFNMLKGAALIGPGLATVILEIGLAGLLVHAALDSDLQIRRLYMIFGFTALFSGAILCCVPASTKLTNPFGVGFLLLIVGLVFLVAFLRHETELPARRWTELVLGGAGAILAAVALVGGNIKGQYLLPNCLLLAGLGLAYLTSFILVRGQIDDISYRVGMAITGVGLVVFVVALCRSALPPLFYELHWLKVRPTSYVMPYGLILMVLGLAYAGTGACLYSERPLFVLTRREMGAIFYSPIFFVILAVSVAANWVSYLMGVLPLLDERGGPFDEPIVRRFIFQLPTVLFTIGLVPALTMRLVSEEKRTGTMEVLLTAPVDETSVVLSKFLATWVMFLISWMPLGLDLVLLRIDGGSPFDYYPLLSFFVGLCFTGAAFVSMGLFFSSLTRNQIISGAMALATMVVLTMVYVAAWVVRQITSESSAWVTVLTHVSYLDVWFNLLDGRLEPRLLLSFASMTVLFQYLTIKVLEARKWL